MPEIVKSVGISGAYWDPYLPWLLSRRFWITVFMAVIVPLAYLPTLNALRYTSTVALMSVAYLWCIVVFHYIGDETVLPPEDEAQYVKLSWSFFNNLPIFVFAFTCHQNVSFVRHERFVAGSTGSGGKSFQVLIFFLMLIYFNHRYLPSTTNSKRTPPEI